MTDDLHRELRFLERDYPGMPPAVRRIDLKKINDIRSRLGLPLVDAELHELSAAPPKPAVESPPDARFAERTTEGDEPPKHAEARAAYRAYLQRIAELQPHREYADRVAQATGGPGTTPVRPLATMGTNGGPLLCDHCGRAIVLEGGNFHNVPADEAWRSHPRDFHSYILGGLVVEQQTNGTLRIYHGYPSGDPSSCCNVASTADTEARAAFDSTARTAHRGPLRAFIEAEFPEMTERRRQQLLDDVLTTLFDYDPGIGVNRPPPTT